jgi:hypothetical protein
MEALQTVTLAVRKASQTGPPPAEPLSANPVATVLAIAIIIFLVVTAKVYMKVYIIKQPEFDDLIATIGAVSAIITGSN